MKRILVFLLVGLLVSTAYATQQTPEKLLYKGKEYRLACLPLEKYFDANNPRPREFRVYRTSLRRGYIGTWEIKDKKLYLRSLARHGRNRSMKEIPISIVFKDQKPPIKATWCTGVLRIPQGNILRSAYMVFSSPNYDEYLHAGFQRSNSFQIFEKDVYMGIVGGNIVSEHFVDNRKEGATRSIQDWGWVAAVSEPVKDDFRWYDLHIVESEAFSKYKESGKSFRTRGIYFESSDSKQAGLWIPATPATDLLMIWFNSVPESQTIKHKQHVEIRAHFEKKSDCYSLHVDSIRPLRPGETMHHPDFKPPEKPPKKTR